ncbi:EboA domain-containing protein [Streptosporangium sp. NPDC004379]|uniref:EboA domain-containing protein n=1 Tax=Streptosporangium sp. NPDC004379 TaxID=3366189 RepID=UPI00368DF9E8
MEARELRAVLGREWVTDACAEIGRRPETIGRHFAAAGRRAGRTPLAGAPGWRADEAARAVLLAALPAQELAARLPVLYAEGTAEEKLAVLRALPLLPAGVRAAPLLRDAIRTNDSRLLAAALGPAAGVLDQAEWRQAVLKCVFTGVPLAAVHDLDGRADGELAAMLAGLAAERAAAGRAMPPDASALLGRLNGRLPGRLNGQPPGWPGQGADHPTRRPARPGRAADHPTRQQEA